MIDSKRCAAVMLAALLVVLGTPADAQQGAPQQAAPQRGSQEQAPRPGLEGAPPAVPPTAGTENRSDRGIPIETVLAQFAASSGKEILIDPRVRANVHGVPAIENPTYPQLLSILRMHGYVAVEIEGRINVVPDAFARSLPTRLQQRDDPNVPDDEWVTRVIAVPGGGNVAALVPILRPLLPQAAHLVATADGKLVIVDTYANVRRITELVRVLSE